MIAATLQKPNNALYPPQAQSTLVSITATVQAATTVTPKPPFPLCDCRGRIKFGIFLCVDMSDVSQRQSSLICSCKKNSALGAASSRKDLSACSRQCLTPDPPLPSPAAMQNYINTQKVFRFTRRTVKIGCNELKSKHRRKETQSCGYNQIRAS